MGFMKRTYEDTANSKQQTAETWYMVEIREIIENKKTVP